MAQWAIGERQRRIVGVLPTGQIIPVICGAETSSLTDPEAQVPPEGDPSGLGDGSTGGSANPNVVPDTQSGRVYTQADIDAVTARMRAADQRAAQLDQKNREYENASKSELDRAKSMADEATARAEAAEKALLDMRIHNAFLTSNKFTWQNPAAALRLIDLSNVTVDPTTGDVTGLDAAIEALSKSDPYLLKPQDHKPDGQTRPAASTPSGNNPSANGGKGRKDDRAALLAKYPALRR